MQGAQDIVANTTDDPRAMDGAAAVPHAIISYDDTLSDRDALALGRVLAEAGARLTLAYVRHTTQSEPVIEELEENEAQTLLERGADRLGASDVGLRIVVSGSTGEGLARLAREEAADLVVFGSDYRTAAGHLSPQHTTQFLLEGGSTAVALAPAGYHSAGTQKLARIGVFDDSGDPAATQTAQRLAESLRAEVVSDRRQIDLLIIASRHEAPPGQVMLTARALKQIEDASCPVLVLARSVPIGFGAPVAASS
jgi:nucleotide-binding universal stress UspA family protein